MGLVIPGDYHERVGGNRQATVQVIADGTDSNSTNVAMGYAVNLVNAYNEQLARERLTAAGQVVPPRAIDARIRVLVQPAAREPRLHDSGIVALLLLVITTNLSSMAVVREKELGTLEQLNVTPVTRWQLILGKLLPYGVIGILDVILVTTVAVTWFQIPLLGSPLLLFATSCIYLLTTLGLGVGHHHFGEGEYERSERVLQELLGLPSRDLVRVHGDGDEAAPDWARLNSPETYLGYERTGNFSSLGGPTRARASSPLPSAWNSTIGRSPATGRCERSASS